MWKFVDERSGGRKKKQQFLTWFFKKARKQGQNVGKLSWIHDVVGAGNYSRAEKTLQEVAAEEMADIWNKKTELALAKLAGLAADEGTNTIGRDQTHYDNGLALIEIQEQIHAHVMAPVGAAVDERAAYDLAVENFASRLVKDLPGMKRLLKKTLKALLRQIPLTAEELIDLLTLMDSIEWFGMPEEDPKVCGEEFALALKVVDLSALSAPAQDDLRALIWRRAMIRDDWLMINDTSGKDDEWVQQVMQQTSLFRTLQHVFMQEQVEGTAVHLFSPNEILGREVFPSSVQERFPENEVEGLRKDLDKEQGKLQKFIEKGRLEDHYGGLVSAAQRDVRGVVDEQGEQMAQVASNSGNSGNSS